MGTVYESFKAEAGDVDYTIKWNIGEVKIPCEVIKYRIIDAKINKKLYGSNAIKVIIRKNLEKKGIRSIITVLKKLYDISMLKNTRLLKKLSNSIEN